MACPPVDVIQAIVAQRATREERARFDAHARSCTNCRDLVELAHSPEGGGELAAPLLAGDVVGGFVIQEVIGEGAMGIVYAAHDADLARSVALKVLRQDSAARDDRLAREAQALARVPHENVCAVYELGTHEGRLFIAMERVDGGTLAQWLRDRPRSVEEILGVFVAAARGLAAAHGAGVLHRDFKPENVLVGKDGRARVTDFGLAGWVTAPGAPPTALDLTQSGTVLGTPLYMSPEQFAGESADERSDQYSFAASLYHALYGVTPFAGRSFEELSANTRAGRLQPVSARVPRWLARVLRRALSVRRADRFPDLVTLVRALEQGPRQARLRNVVLGGGLLVAFAVGATVLLQGHDAASRCDEGDGAACLELAARLRRGTDVAAAAPEVVALYRRGCDGGNQEACAELGGAHARGYGGPVSFERAAALFLDACDHGQADACAALGALHHQGSGVSMDDGRAFSLAERACADGSGSGCQLTAALRFAGNVAPHEPVRAMDDLRRACRLGSSGGCFLAGLRLRAGIGAPIDEAAGRALTEESARLAQAGCPAGGAEDCLVVTYLEATGALGPARLDRAAAAAARGCDLGDAGSCQMLGNLTLVGMGVPRDVPRGRALLQAACDRHEARACLDLGSMLAVGIVGVPADVPRARAMFEEQCRRTSGAGCAPLALLYWRGIGVPHDPARALDLATRACELRGDDGLACYFAAQLHSPGEAGADETKERAFAAIGCEQTSSDACEWEAQPFLRKGDGAGALPYLLRACRIGGGTGCTVLASLYLEGRGVTKDVPRARQMLEEGCKLNQGDACAHLGTLYLEGKEVPANPFLAVDFFQRGCERLDAKACLAGAALLDGGKGVAPDPTRATEMRQQACTGHPELCPDAGP